MTKYLGRFYDQVAEYLWLKFSHLNDFGNLTDTRRIFAFLCFLGLMLGLSSRKHSHKTEQFKEKKNFLCDFLS